MQPYVEAPATGTKSLPASLFEYDLFAVVTHEGRLDNGHYWADVLSGDEWWHCDDDKGAAHTTIKSLKANCSYSHDPERRFVATCVHAVLREAITSIRATHVKDAWCHTEYSRKWTLDAVACQGSRQSAVNIGITPRGKGAANRGPDGSSDYRYGCVMRVDQVSTPFRRWYGFDIVTSLLVNSFDVALESHLRSARMYRSGVKAPVIRAHHCKRKAEIVQFPCGKCTVSSRCRSLVRRLELVSVHIVASACAWRIT
jgi:hypothetical protein